MKRIAIVAAFAAALATVGTAGAEEPLVVATLDFAFASQGSLLQPAFRKTAKGWQAVLCTPARCENYDHPEREQTWYLWRDGIQIGSLVSRGLRPDGALNVISSTLPHLGDGSFDNDKDSQAVAVNRPLTAMPSGWRRDDAVLPADQEVWPLIAKAAPMVAICHDHDEDKPRPSRIGDLHVRQMWSSKTGESLVLYGVSDSDNDCDGPPTEQEDVLIYRDAKGGVHLVPGQFACRAVALYPGPIADVDGDGKDEALIAYEGEDCFGLTLYADGFAKYVRRAISISTQ